MDVLQVAIRDLANAAVVGNWLRVAKKGKPDYRNEFSGLAAELQIRGLIEPPTRTAGEQMIRDLNTASNLGNRVPAEYLRSRRPQAEEVASPETPPIPNPASSVSGETDAEFAGRVKLLMEVLSRTEISDSAKAQIIASLKRN